MKQLIDFMPLMVFFVVYKLQGIYVATGALVAATALQIIVSYLLVEKVEKMQLITFVMVALFGGMTLFFHNDNFIKWKVTIVYTLLAIGLAVSQAQGRNAIKGLLGQAITLPESVWSKMNTAWIVFFLACAGLNILVAVTLPLDIWVNFKVFGLLGITLLFTLVTGFYLYKNVRHVERNERERDHAGDCVRNQARTTDEPDHTS